MGIHPRREVYASATARVEPSGSGPASRPRGSGGLARGRGQQNGSVPAVTAPGAGTEVAPGPRRSLRTLPKAHLHLHFTGSMRHPTLVDLADQAGVRLPRGLREEWPPVLAQADERGWFRFQRLYDVARTALRGPADVRRLLDETIADEAAEGSRWLEIQVDPSGYAATFGGLTPFTELVLDAVATSARKHSVGVGVIIAANRTRNELDARTLARLATRFTDRGVVGFGLSNDERRGPAEAFDHAFAIAGRAGLLLTPHAGELLGPESVRATLDELHPDRLGHGVRVAEDPALLDRVAAAGIGLEVCPASNVGLGVYPDMSSVPLRTLVDAGAEVALGADDPLLFGHRLIAQYAAARTIHHFDDAALAGLARSSFAVSRAPSDVVASALADIDAWLLSPPGDDAANT
jgi:adenosine deaminase